MTEQDFILRACRAAVRDHAVRDLLAYMPEPLEDETLHDALTDRMLYMKEMRDHATVWSEQPRRTVADCLTDAEVLGKAKDIDPKYARKDTIVVRVRYARTWLADYEVGPDTCFCWQD